MEKEKLRDRKFVCKNCGKTFVWTAGEQQFYKEKNLENQPQVCPKCRREKKVQKKIGKSGSSKIKR